MRTIRRGDRQRSTRVRWTALNKTPLDLRDRTVVSIDPDQVKRIAIVKETFAPRRRGDAAERRGATTQASTQPDVCGQ